MKIRTLVVRLLGVALAVVCAASLSSAQQVEMSSTLNPVGSGARATGMGGAFIAVADDATAASWNPAGLIQLERPEISIVYSFFSQDQTYHATEHPEINTANSMSSEGINYASLAFPFVLFSRNMVVGLNYQRQYEMNKSVNFRYTFDLGGGNSLTDDINFHQKGYLYTLSPALAVQVAPNFSLGLTLNFWSNQFGHNGWENTYRSNGTGVLGTNTIAEQLIWKTQSTFEGQNMNIGALWHITDSVAMGAVYKTKFNGVVRTDTSFYQYHALGGVPSLSPLEEYRTKSTMKMPPSYGIGFKYRKSDTLAVALDMYKTEWSKFYIVDPSGTEVNPLDTAPISEGRLKDTMQTRFGMEYLFIGKNTIALRGGLFSDPEPSKGKVNNFYGYTLGTGYSTEKFSIDASYQYRKGKNADGDIAFVQRNAVDITQQTFLLSGIYYY